MSVTILYQGAMLTFPDLDDPKEAYRRLQGGGATGASEAGPATNQFDSSSIQKGIDPKLLSKNADWLAASKILYERTQGTQWKGSEEQLADWGLDRMARFSYNLPLMGADAVALKNAPDDQKKAFLFLLDNFEKVAYSWGGVGNFVKYAAIDPTNWVGLSTLGIGTAAAQGAKLTTLQGIKSALKVGAVGALEGAAYGGAQQRIEQEARVNAGGQAEVDYGKVAQGAAIGGAAGAVLAPALTVGINALTRRGVQNTPPQAPTEAVQPQVAPQGTQVAPPVTAPPAAPVEPQQMGLNLGDMFDPNQAAQVRMDRLAEQGKLNNNTLGDDIRTLPSARDAYQEYREPMLPMFMPEDPSRTVKPYVDPYANADPNVPYPPSPFGYDWAPVTSRKEPTLPFARERFKGMIGPPGGLYDGQGDLFARNLPEQINANQAEYNRIDFTERTADALERDGDKALAATMREEALAARKKLDEMRYKDALQRGADQAFDANPKTPEMRKTEATLEAVNKPTPDERIGQKSGPSFNELRQLLSDLASGTSDGVFKSLERLLKVSDPMRRALSYLSPDEARQITRDLMKSAYNNKERELLHVSIIRAQNAVDEIARKYRDDLKLAQGELKNSIEARLTEFEKVFTPLRDMARESSSIAGRTLNRSKLSKYKAETKDASVDLVLKDMGIDPAKASPEQRLEAYLKFLDDTAGDAQRVLQETDTRLIDARRRILEANVEDDDVIKLWDELALVKQEIEAERLAGLTNMQLLRERLNNGASRIGYYMAATVLSPSSTTINAMSNAFRVYTRPFMEYLARGPLEYESFREMTAAYGAMFRTSREAFALARKAFEINASPITGAENKWLERQASSIGVDNSTLRFVDRNFIQIWLRILGATDEFFYKVAYQGFNEGRAVSAAIKEASEKGYNATEREALVKQALEQLNAKIYNSQIDTSVIGQLRQAGMEKGLSGEELRLFVRNELDNNADLYKRATDQQGIDYVDDLLFRKEFSGEGVASSLAKNYEEMVRKFPAMRIIGQLFFRTPVRVFEAGLRMTPGMQLLAPKFIGDLKGENGALRQLRAQAEALFAYGFATSVMMGYATGKITGDGGGLDYRERRRLEDSGWKPYSIKVGDTYVSFRNMDPFSTPIKIMVNAMERLQRLEYQRAQGVLASKEDYKSIVRAVDVAVSSVAMAIRDANLTSGADELLSLGEALADPDKHEKDLLRFVQSKVELAVPNVIRKGIKSFGDEQNVLNEPATMDQVLSNVLNPSSDQINHQYDALGFKRNIPTQGLAAFMGFDIADVETRARGLSERDRYSLREIAKMTYATGSRFIPPAKSAELYDDKDLRQIMTADGTTTIYNKAMEEYNRNMPSFAYHFLKSTENIPMGRQGKKGPRVEEFEKLQQRLWTNAVRTVASQDQQSFTLRSQRFQNRFEVQSGMREVSNPLLQ